jgi:hypothetical protein
MRATGVHGCNLSKSNQHKENQMTYHHGVTVVGPGHGSRRLVLFPLALALAMTGCGAAEHGDRDTGAAAEVAAAGPALAYGEAVPLGNGSMRTYVVMEAGAPVELGVALTESAMSGLPDHHSPGGIMMPDGLHMFPYVLELPANHGTPFRHVAFDWNPGGHEPPGVYDKPHFDVHFYMIEVAERMAIDPVDPQFGAKAANLPPAEYLPAGYITPVPDAVPMMGLHWLSASAGELQGRPFDKTFIYGSWDGKLIFLEPMITKAFLEARPDFVEEIVTPQSFAVPGRYPSAYRIQWNEAAREYRIALTGFQPRS